jgi:hypothetical protein
MVAGFPASKRERDMPVQEYTRNKGQGFKYSIEYAMGEYFILRDHEMKKSVPDATIAGVAPGEAKPDLMLKMAIADIEDLAGMDE